ncbi:MAG TPA: molybdopterin-dependent oxidoreductase [Ktedonobacterales bacterium]|jgi:DMSO/TMAO reductase YedYZ molybdopterin-dependent catalytic subunit|nr:molybdopterin-dependent oxidoreductase [Ktedonobacterales bacterium]
MTTTSSPQPAIDSTPAWRAVLASSRAVVPEALIASGAALLVAIGLRLLVSLPTTAEYLGDAFTRLIPLPLFSAMLAFLGPNAKHLLVGTLFVVSALYMTALGALYVGVRHWIVAQRTPGSKLATDREVEADEQRDPFELTYAEVPLLLLWIWLPTLIILPLVGLLAGDNPLPWFTAQLPMTLVFGLSFVALLRAWHRTSAEVAAATPAGELARVNRRRMLRDAGFVLLVVAGGVITWEAISGTLGALFGGGLSGEGSLRLDTVPKRIVPPPTPNYTAVAPVAGQTAEVTSAANFYYVSKNFINDPQLNAATWQLRIGGMVDHPYTLSYAELQALPVTERYHTLECISNEIGGDLMSNAFFRGTKLADILNKAGIQQGATNLIFKAADGYSDSLHLAQALDPRALVVYHINGGPLPQPHGFPARLLIPNLYGMKNGKWLTDLDLGSGTYTGYWEERGWTREAVAKMMSRVDTPHDGQGISPRATSIAGVAYAGERGISEVQVSVDAGQTWQSAELRRPLGALTWTLWVLPWTPAAGRYVITCRAVDLGGSVQQPDQAPPLPDGSSGYHVVTVVVG